ncbi:hypothetical protein ACFDAU_06260 [Sulfuriferula sp. GW1]|uniref:hypothetical protein n=1 Tax=Sulfuriferula sp. GW1 TaxID=3345111 RepID=UPI0039AF0BD0
MSRDAFQIVESIIAGNPPTTEDWEWFADGLRQWARRGMPLEAALGLTHAHRMRWRDGSLRAAAEVLRAQRDLSAWDLAGELAARLRRFQSAKLPLYRRGLAGQLDEVELHLLSACESGARPITSRRHLFRLLDIR